MTSALRPPRVGTLAWEQAGGPPLSLPQRVELLAGALPVVAGHFAGLLAWSTGLLKPPAKIDLGPWALPDSGPVRDAVARLRETSTPEMAHHSHRTYWFSAVACETAAPKLRVDREALALAALMHDVTLGEPNPPATEHCFTVGSARRARQLATAAAWDEARQDRVAAAITSNLNPSVPAEVFGPEAHAMSLGGQIEVFAEEWKVHPDNLAEILARHPRSGFAADALRHVGQEARLHPGCRFAVLSPMFPLLVRSSTFRAERALAPPAGR